MTISHPAFEITRAVASHGSTPIAQPVVTSFGTMSERHAVFLLVKDASGNTGVGESWINFPVWGHLNRVAAFEHTIIPWLNGKTVEHVPDTIQQLFNALQGPARQSGTMGPLLSAICAVELALWDLAAQAAGKPLAQLLFADPLDKVRVYASGINTPLPSNLIDAHLDNGVTLFKLKLGFGDETDRRNLTDLKHHLGDRAKLAVDVNRGWTFAQAKTWLPVLQDLDIQWLEEPLRYDEETHLAELQSLSAVPLSGAENIQMEPGGDVAAYAAAPFDILQPDITKYTPLHVALALREQGEALGKRVVPHILGSGPGQAASLHLAAGCAEGLVELDINENRLRTRLCEPSFEIVDGCIELPKVPGLGWRLKFG